MPVTLPSRMTMNPNLQVRWAVVETIAVLVVDYLVPHQLSTQDLLHH